MKLIYKAQDIIEAQIISGLLSSNDIDSHVGGYYLQGGVGDLAAADFATISVADKDTEMAMLIIRSYENNKEEMHPSKIKGNKLLNVPFIAIAVSIIMLAWLSIAFSDYN